MNKEKNFDNKYLFNRKFLEKSYNIKKGKDIKIYLCLFLYYTEICFANFAHEPLNVG